MASSIKEHGVRQPLTVIVSDKKGEFEVISGERRLKAAIEVGLDTVPCIILEDKNAAQEIAIIENIHRQDLHPLELGSALHSLLEKKIFENQSVIAKRLAMSESSVSELMKFSLLPSKIKSFIVTNNIRHRDKLRKLLTFKGDIEDIEEFLGVKRKVSSKSNYSVMRINIANDSLKYQLNGINNLSALQKAELKVKLKSIIEDL